MISGFLGTGKTTLLLRLAEYARHRDQKIAILVNEIGEIGVDNQLMEHLGFDVRELLGGCICCTLAGNVLETLKNLRTEANPDLVLLEPTGAADPRNLVKTIGASDLSLFHSIIKVALLDPLRLDMLMAVASPLILSSLEPADVVLINKTDVASSEELDSALAIASEYASEAQIMSISAKNELTSELIGSLLPWLHST